MDPSGQLVESGFLDTKDQAFQGNFIKATLRRLVRDLRKVEPDEPAMGEQLALAQPFFCDNGSLSMRAYLDRKANWYKPMIEKGLRQRVVPPIYARSMVGTDGKTRFRIDWNEFIVDRNNRIKPGSEKAQWMEVVVRSIGEVPASLLELNPAAVCISDFVWSVNDDQSTLVSSATQR